MYILVVGVSWVHELVLKIVIVGIIISDANADDSNNKNRGVGISGRKEWSFVYCFKSGKTRYGYLWHIQRRIPSFIDRIEDSMGEEGTSS